jgi:hypothetical protein
MAINTDGSTANASALLDIKSNSKGVLIPRMSKAEKNAIASPATGLMIFQYAPDSIGFYYYDGSNWLWMATATTVTGWATTGNAGTDTAVNFIGTTDNMPIRFKQNYQWLGQFDGNKQNYFIGESAGQNITSGNANIAIGNLAMANNTAGWRNVAVGDSAMYTQSFNGGSTYFMDNTAIGSKALFSNQPNSLTNGIKNTAVGSEALYLNTTGQENTAVGTGALHNNLTGSRNTAIGRSAHRLSKSGSDNSYYGYQSGYNDSLGTGNTAIGSITMENHRNGNYNVAIGYLALNTDTSGFGKVALGTGALYNDRSVTLPKTAVGFDQSS